MNDFNPSILISKTNQPCLKLFYHQFVFFAYTIQVYFSQAVTEFILEKFKNLFIFLFVLKNSLLLQ
jgi:hypothetical protein